MRRASTGTRSPTPDAVTTACGPSWRELGDNRQLFAPGTAWSYNNAAFVVAGRLVEVVADATWDAALRERVVEPLGLTRTVTLPEEALLHRVALGHVDDEDGHPVPAPVSMLPRSCGPAGLIWSTVADQLAFATAHLRGGVRPDGTRLLGAEQVAAMAAEQAARVDATGCEDATSWGLGWARGSWDGTPVLGHDGNTIGQSAFLRLLPEHGLATVLLTNGGDPDPLHRELLGELLADLAGITVPATGGPGAGTPRAHRSDGRHVGAGQCPARRTPRGRRAGAAAHRHVAVRGSRRGGGVGGDRWCRTPTGWRWCCRRARPSGDRSRWRRPQRDRTCCTSAGGPTPGCEPAAARARSGVDAATGRRTGRRRPRRAGPPSASRCEVVVGQRDRRPRPTFSSRYVTRLVPGIGTTSSPCASTQASASWPGVQPFSSATRG